MKDEKSKKIVLGWREWVSLPDLGVARIKAKIDTGARTSALHAEKVEIFRSRGLIKARFVIYPFQHRSDSAVHCEAVVIDERYVTDSGGHREKRYVIETRLRLGERVVGVEMTLSKRDSMQFRMLLGRTALKQVLVDPRHSFLLGHKK